MGLALSPEDAMGRNDLGEAVRKKTSQRKRHFGWTVSPRGRVSTTVLPGRSCSMVTRRSDSHLSVRCDGHTGSVEVTVFKSLQTASSLGETAWELVWKPCLYCQ